MSIEISSPLELAAESTAAEIQSEKFVQSFGGQMMVMKIIGLISVALHKFTVFLHACALTWASLLVLSQASYLYKDDVTKVAILLVFEAVSFVYRDIFNRLMSTTGFNFVMFSRRQHDRDKLKAICLNIPRLFAILLVFLFQLWKAQLSTIELASGKHEYAKIETMAYPNLIEFSLQVFYLLVTINAYIGMFTDYSCHIAAIAWARWEWASQLGYFDAVMLKGIQEGFMKASTENVFEFAYQFQSMKYSRGMNPLVVLEKHPKLIKYLFYKQEGIEYTFLALGSDDLYKQIAAASIIGLWARIDGVDCRKLRWLHANLFPKLADKLQGSGLVGEAAADSFFFLGIKHPDMVLRMQTSDAKNIVDILMDLIHIDNPIPLCYIRALIPLIETLHEKGWQTSDAGKVENAELERQLTQMILEKPRLKVRQRVTVAYALFKLLGNTLSKNVKKYLEELSPVDDDGRLDHKEFWMENEKKWMEEMLGGKIPRDCEQMRVILGNGFFL